MWCIYMNGILLSHKEEWNEPIATTRMELEMILLSEVSQAERQIPYNTVTVNAYMWNLKYNTNEPIYEIETDSPT